MSPFKDNPWLSFLVVPMSFIFQECMRRITDLIREWLISGRERDAHGILWDEYAEKAEDDVMGLSLSFLMMMSFRFLICGHLGEIDGGEEIDQLGKHTTQETVLLCATALGFILLTAWSIYQHEVMEQAEKEREKAEEEKEDRRLEKCGTEEERMTSTPTSNAFIPGSQELKDRLIEALIVVGSVGYAWCAFFSAKWMLGGLSFFEDQDEMVLLGVCLALFISFISFPLIVVMDRLADAEWTSDSVDKAIIQMIGAIGILVGFAWEQSFDAAVESLAGETGYPKLAKVLLALFCVALLVLAWRLYMLPMVVKEGWRFGFVLDAETMAEVVKHLKESKEAADKGTSENRTSSKLAADVHHKVVEALEREYVTKQKDWHRSRTFNVEELLSPTSPTESEDLPTRKLSHASTRRQTRRLNSNSKRQLTRHLTGRLTHKHAYEGDYVALHDPERYN